MFNKSGDCGGLVCTTCYTRAMYISVTVNFPASECLLSYILKIFLCLQIECFSENLKGCLGKIQEDNIKIDAREMKFEGVHRMGGLNVIFITPTLLEIINFRHLHSPLRRLK